MEVSTTKTISCVRTDATLNEISYFFEFRRHYYRVFLASLLLAITL